MTTHFDNILSEYQCGFQKRILLKYGKKNKDKRGSFAALLTDLVAFYLTCLLPNYLLMVLIWCHLN